MIRAAEPNDAEALLGLAQQLATSFEVNEIAFQHCFTELLSAPDAYLAIAEVDGEVIGYILGFDHYTFYANGRVAWVEEIIVRADHRRQGIGTSLMTSFEEWAIARGCKLIALATRRAAEFYTAIRYEASATYFRKKL